MAAVGMPVTQMPTTISCVSLFFQKPTLEKTRTLLMIGEVACAGNRLGLVVSLEGVRGSCAFLSWHLTLCYGVCVAEPTGARTPTPKVGHG